MWWRWDKGGRVSICKSQESTSKTLNEGIEVYGIEVYKHNDEELKFKIRKLKSLYFYSYFDIKEVGLGCICVRKDTSTY